MNINSLTLLLTEKCNFNCKYCYQWDADGQDIDPIKAKQIVKYALENSSSDLDINFSGGEPLLKFNLIQKCIFYIKKNSKLNNKKVSFSLITNGSLINDEVLEFLDNNNCEIQYSFDVYLKYIRTEKDKYLRGRKILKKLLHLKNIELSTNTVFTPDKADIIAESVKFLYLEGVTKIGIGIDQTSLWKEKDLQILKSELSIIKDLVVSEYKRTGRIIVDYFNLKNPSGIKVCGAGGDQLTMTPNGDLWGCPSFHYLDWENINEQKDNYFYGNVNDLENGKFEKRYEEIKSNINEFRTDNFFTDDKKCFLCEYLQECLICPAQKYSFSNGRRSMLHIPEQICEMNKIIFNSNRAFKQEIKDREYT